MIGMVPEFEVVYRVDDYYDGVREGIADFRGAPHRFRCLGWDLPHRDPDEDRFHLTPVSPGTGPTLIARGEFRAREPIPQLPPGIIRPQEVRWSPIE